jgi:putative hydrolase of the HAD superfamily
MTEVGPLREVHVVFFDLYNTLARFWPPREELQEEACRAFGVEVTPEGVARGYAVADAFMACENAGPNPIPSRSAKDQQQFFVEYQKLILEGAGVVAEDELVTRLWNKVRELPYDLVLFNDVLPALVQLKELGLTLGLISNLDRDGKDLIQHLGMSLHIDLAVTSREVGFGKPHPAIFREALSRAQALPEQAAHIGDQYQSDVEGALGVGIHPVLMDRFGTLDHPAGLILVRDMAEVVELLGS